MNNKFSICAPQCENINTFGYLGPGGLVKIKNTLAYHGYFMNLNCKQLINHLQSCEIE